MNSPAVRALLRLAGRDALRHKGRSLLILLTLTFPVAGLVAAVTLVHALTVPPATKASWTMGSADAILQVEAEQPTAAGAKAAVAAAVPAGATTLVYTDATSRVAAVDGLLRTADVSDLPYTDPVAAGMVHQRQGRAPRTADEVSVATSLAHATHLRIGSQLVLRDVDGGRTVTVVGIAEVPAQLDSQQVWTAPNTLAGAADARVLALVTMPPGTSTTDWAAHLSHGNAMTRDTVLRPPRHTSALAASQSTGLEVLVVGLALLEAVLMAGAAFGVGARRSQRDLALLAATGGDAGHVRRVVLSGAVVLGAIAGVAGTVFGFVAAWSLLPKARGYSNHDYAGLHPRPLELIGAVLLGVVTGLVSAWLPARGAAKAPIVASLSGHRGIVRSSPTRIVLALATAAVGTLCCAWAGRSQSLGGQQFNAILLFAAVAELGFAGCAPSLVGLAGRVGGRLPLATRLSLRDIARNRSRTGPAVAAVMATLSGVVAIGVYVASEHARHLADFTPTLPDTMATLYLNTDTPLSTSVERSVAASLRATGSYAFGDGQAGTSNAYVRQDTPGHNVIGGDLLIGGPELLTALGIPQAAPALAAGKAVVITGLPLDNGAVTVELSDANGNQTSRSLAAVAAKVGVYRSLGSAVISPAAATSLGLTTTTNRRLWTMPGKPSQHQIDAANAALLAGSTSASAAGSLVTAESLNDRKLLLVPLALLAISTLVTLGVTAISTALSAAESKGDFATLSAVGATPGVRRRLAMGQAGVLALLGGILGIAAGLVPIGAVIAVRSDVLTFTVPWQVIALALVGVPLLAALGAGLFTRSRLPLVRRLT